MPAKYTFHVWWLSLHFIRAFQSTCCGEKLKKICCSAVPCTVTDWNLTSGVKEQLGDLNAAHQLDEPTVMTAHTNTTGDFLCLLIFNAYTLLRQQMCECPFSKSIWRKGVCQAEQAVGRVTCGRPNTDTQEDK